MDEFVKSLDPALGYLTHETHEHNIIITVESSRHEIVCPYCSKKSSRVHSVYRRQFQDLPLQDKQVTIILNNKKYFCDNQDCSHRTFAERFDFISKRTIKDVLYNYRDICMITPTIIFILFYMFFELSHPKASLDLRL